MRAASLFGVFLLAKLAVLSGHTVPLTYWAPVAYLWQDALIVLVFAVLDAAVQRIGQTNGLSWLIYWTLAFYSAINIPVGRAVSTALTRPMLRAARGPLADSLLLYITWENTALVMLTLTAAAVLPLVVRRTAPRFLTVAAAGALLIVPFGPAASARVETLGLGRNALVTLIASGFPRVRPLAVAVDWRASHFDRHGTDDLSGLRGIAKSRNVILVSLESTGAEYLSLYGGEYDVTPHLSELARNSVVFENAYAVYPESIKGLFSILCSTFPAFDSKPEMYEETPCRSVAAVLADNGYCTALFHSGRFAYLGMESIIRNRGYETLEDASDIGGNHQSSFGVDEPSTVRRILAWIDTVPRGRRFFLTYLPIAGHHPYETPVRGPFPEREEIGRYRNALRYGDESLGALVAGVRARGLDQNTLWIILGDHGEAFGQHEGNYGHTFFLYDENIHVPLVIVAAGLITGQTRVHNVVSLVDTAPTLLDLVRLPPPRSYQGRSMLDSAPRMALFFTDYSLSLLGLRDGPWKFVYELESGRTKIFDLDRDPHERADLSVQNAERAAWYTGIVRGWSGAQTTYLAHEFSEPAP